MRDTHLLARGPQFYPLHYEIHPKYSRTGFSLRSHLKIRKICQPQKTYLRPSSHYNVVWVSFVTCFVHKLTLYTSICLCSVNMGGRFLKQRINLKFCLKPKTISRCKLSVMWHYVRQVVPSVWKDHSTFIFRVRQSHVKHLFRIAQCVESSQWSWGYMRNISFWIRFKTSAVRMLQQQWNFSRLLKLRA